MFTGLITAVGTIIDRKEKDNLITFTLAAPYESLAIGASVAHNGVCLTVLNTDKKDLLHYSVDAAPETLALTTAKDWHIGQRINLETSLKMGDELGGHMVSGHVDGVAEILKTESIGKSRQFWLKIPESLLPFLAPKGSVALDGTSLTINSVEGDILSVLLIPHTLEVTTWGTLKTGDRVNVEVDSTARTVVNFLKNYLKTNTLDHAG